MGKLTSSQRSFVIGVLGPCVSFNRTERMLYSHDVAALPGLLKPFVGTTTGSCTSA